MKQTDIDRFCAKVDKTSDPRGCWVWTAYKDRDGYGHYNLGKKYGLGRAHRFSYVLHNGPMSKDLFVCHHCDNPSCVNPDHLFVGTHKDNMRDMNKKGRQKPNYNGRPKIKVKTPLGIFNSIKDAAAAHNIGTAPLHYRLKKYPNDYYRL